MVKVEVIQGGVHRSGKPVAVGEIIEITENHYECCKARFKLVEDKSKTKRQRAK